MFVKQNEIEMVGCNQWILGLGSLINKLQMYTLRFKVEERMSHWHTTQCALGRLIRLLFGGKITRLHRRNMGFEVRQWKFHNDSLYLLAVWALAKYLTSLNLSYITCKMGQAIPTEFIGIKYNHVFKMVGRETLWLKEYKTGLSWWRSGWESACQCRGHGFEPWSGRIPHAVEQLDPWATITEPARLEPVLRNKRGRDSERPAHRDEEWSPLATIRESPHTETKTQHSHK